MFYSFSNSNEKEHKQTDDSKVTFEKGFNVDYSMILES